MSEKQCLQHGHNSHPASVLCLLFGDFVFNYLVGAASLFLSINRYFTNVHKRVCEIKEKCCQIRILSCVCSFLCVGIPST